MFTRIRKVKIGKRLALACYLFVIAYVLIMVALALFAVFVQADLPAQAQFFAPIEEIKRSKIIADGGFWDRHSANDILTSIMLRAWTAYVFLNVVKIWEPDDATT